MEMSFEDLVALRWGEACAVTGAPDSWVTWDYGSYPHFKKKRGYGVTFLLPDKCHLRFAKKICRAPEHRADGILRHEIGHVIDLMVPAGDLNQWAAKQGYILPSTQERRADAIAYVIWKEPIRYDSDLVQSTKKGVTLRPARLGL